MSKIFQVKINVNFKLLELNLCQKKFQDQINANFKMLGLKRLFTQKKKKSYYSFRKNYGIVTKVEIVFLHKTHNYVEVRYAPKQRKQDTRKNE